MHPSRESAIYKNRFGSIWVQHSHNNGKRIIYLFYYYHYYLFCCLFLQLEACSNIGRKSGQIPPSTEILQSLMLNDKFIIILTDLNDLFRIKIHLHAKTFKKKSNLTSLMSLWTTLLLRAHSSIQYQKPNFKRGQLGELG